MIKIERYEAQYLLNLISAVLNQTELPFPVNGLNWENIFTMADYHNVANVVYYGVLGIETEVPEVWKTRFYEKYQEVLLAQEQFRKAEEVMVRQMEGNHIHSMLLKESVLIKCYEPREIRAMGAIPILVEKGKEYTIDRLMQRMDYRQVIKRAGDGRFYYRIPKTTVAFFSDYGFHTKTFKKYFAVPVREMSKSPGKEYIHELTEEKFYIYLMSDLVYRYARGILEIRSMMDLWVYYKKYKDVLDWIFVRKELDKLGITKFAQRLLNLAYMWFRDKGEKPGTERYPGITILYTTSANLEEEKAAYRTIETYIFTKGKQEKENSEKLLPLIREVEEAVKKEEKKEQRHARLLRVFPNRRDMQTIFPVLERRKYLLCLCWIARWLMLLFSPVHKKIKSLRRSVKNKLGKTQTENYLLQEESSYDGSHIEITQEIRQSCPGVALGILQYTIEVGESTPEFLQIFGDTLRRLAGQYSLTEISSIPHILATRQAYQSLGKSPSENRNRAESLLRQVVGDGYLPTATNVEDISNLMSVSYGYSIGSYNISALSGAAKLCKGTGEPDGKGDKKGALPVLADAKGEFGNPSKDSSRTAVKPGKQNILTVIYSFDGAEELSDCMEQYRRLLQDYCKTTSLEVYSIE